MKKRKGFTLIELVVVIVILGILLALIFPNVLGVRQRAKETAFEMTKKQLYEAALMFTVDFPNKATNWNMFSGGEQAGNKNITDNYHEAWYLYLDEWPINPIDPNIPFTVEINVDGEVFIYPESR